MLCVGRCSFSLVNKWNNLIKKLDISQSLLSEVNICWPQHQPTLLSASVASVCSVQPLYSSEEDSASDRLQRCNDCPQVFHVDQFHTLLLWLCALCMQLFDWGLKFCRGWLCLGKKRDSCQLTELSAIERANVESDDKVASFSPCNVLVRLPELPMRCLMYRCLHTCQLKTLLFS